MGGALALGAAVLAWDRLVPKPPPLDLAGSDPEVREALEAARSGVLYRPWSSERWGHLGLVLFAHDYYGLAQTCFAEAEALDAADARWPYYQGLVLWQHQAEASVPHFKRAMLQAKHEFAPHLRLAEAWLRHERLAEAEEQFREVLRLSPGHPRATLGLGQLALQRGDAAAALPLLARVSESGPQYQKTATNLLAEAHHRLGAAAAAQQAQAKALGLPDDPLDWRDPYLAEVYKLRVGAAGRVYRAQDLLDQGQARAAVALLQETIEKYPDFYRARVLFARIQMQRGDLVTVEQTVWEALRIAPDFVPARLLLGGLYQMQGRDQDALACFREAIARKPDSYVAHYCIGECLLRTGNQPGALAAFRTALHYKPNLPEAHYQIGRLLAGKGEDKAALEHLQQAVLLAPQNAQARKLRDELAARLGAPTKP